MSFTSTWTGPGSIQVFRDEDELVIGDKINKILRAISHLQICTPIFSKTFAQSRYIVPRRGQKDGRAEQGCCSCLLECDNG